MLLLKHFCEILSQHYHVFLNRRSLDLAGVKLFLYVFPTFFKCILDDSYSILFYYDYMMYLYIKRKKESAFCKFRGDFWEPYSKWILGTQNYLCKVTICTIIPKWIWNTI